MEKWDTYTRDYKLTDRVIIRNEERIPDGLFHIVSEVLVRHRDGSYLLMKRAKTKSQYPDYYEATAGGSALQGENAYDCVKRELFEETGIKCNDFYEVAFNIIDRGHAFFHSFICEVDCDKSSVSLLEGETEDYKWVSEQEFIDFINSEDVIDTQKGRYYVYFQSMGYIKTKYGHT